MIKQEMIEMIKQERNDNSVIILIRSWEDTRFTQRHGSPQRSEAGIDPVNHVGALDDRSWPRPKETERIWEMGSKRWGSKRIPSKKRGQEELSLWALGEESFTQVEQSGASILRIELQTSGAKWIFHS
jgi:hypothetical protein